MGAPDRLTRVNELLKREIANIMEREIALEADCLISVTKVKTSPDLRHARVYISIFGADADKKIKVMRSLKKSRSNIQHKMASTLEMKYTPVIEFFEDENMANADKVFSILSELENDED
jgi:ribosome-binding factor A